MPAAYDNGNQPHVNLYEAAKTPKYTGGLFVRDDKVSANIIYGYEKTAPLLPTDRGHFHRTAGVLARDGRADPVCLREPRVFVAEEGDVPYVPGSTYHLARFHGLVLRAGSRSRVREQHATHRAIDHLWFVIVDGQRASAGQHASNRKSLITSPPTLSSGK